MESIKCKMCGGSLIIGEDQTVAECEYCGSMQTVPSANNEKKLSLFNRANLLRSACEFDQASRVYESIIADFPKEAEAYWGLVLCKYGIEYVDDPATGRKVPTCHRSSYESVLHDLDYKQALENADEKARKVYENEAKVIESLRSGIIGISAKEAPYDIFICYKETDTLGNRTIDSVLAQDLYDTLTAQKYRVFFSRITLEDKLGQEYEPYIFAALHSAKVMLAVGTSAENYNAVWVKNEWSRFLKLLAADEKKTLIPCYKEINPNDMPHEFARLQAQDLGKVGATQDLLRGIEKIIPRRKQTGSNASNIGNSASESAIQVTTQSQLERAEIFLQDRNWKKAYDCYEAILNANPKSAEAYFGELLCNRKCSSKEELLNSLSVDLSKVSGSMVNVVDERNELEQLCSRYVLPGYLEGSEIENIISEKGNYYSRTAQLEHLTAKQLESIRNDDNMVHAMDFAEGEFRNELDAFQMQMEQRLKTEEITQIISAEKNEAALTYEAVTVQLMERRSKAEAEREKDYQAVCQISSVYEIDQIMKLLDKIGDYKDCGSKKEKLLSLHEKEKQIEDDPLYFGKWLADEHKEELQKYLDVAGGSIEKRNNVLGSAYSFWLIALALQVVILFTGRKYVFFTIVFVFIGQMAITSWEGKKGKKISFVITCLCGIILAGLCIPVKPILGICFTVAYVLTMFFMTRNKGICVEQDKYLNQFREYESLLKEDLNGQLKEILGEKCEDCLLVLDSVRGVSQLFDTQKNNGLLDRNYERWLESAHFQLQQHPQAEEKEEEKAGEQEHTVSAENNQVMEKYQSKFEYDATVTLNEEKGQKGIFVCLEEVGKDKVATIKLVRRITGLELSESKALVDHVPQILKSDLTIDEAQIIREELTALGNRVTIQKK